ncbi:MAG: HepT-like ribonuclease domain-containing protein [Cyanobacteria bacterium J06626_23]
MLEAAKEIINLMEGRNRQSLDEDRMLELSVVRLIEIIGEAAANISSDKRQQLSQIPWRDIVSMRNRIVHAYFDIDLKIVWKTIHEDLPALLLQLEAAQSTEDIP